MSDALGKLDRLSQLALKYLADLGKKLSELTAEQQQDPDNPMSQVRLAMTYADRAAGVLAQLPLLQAKGMSSDELFKSVRLDLNSALSCFEKVYVPHLLSTPSENFARLEELADYPELTRYQHLRILGLLLDLLEAANPTREQRWLVNMSGLFDRHAVLLRNSAMLAGMRDTLQQKNHMARTRVSYANLAFRALRDRTEASRIRYESSRNQSDMEAAIRFCGSIIPMLILLRRDEEAQEFKKKREVWERRLNEDIGGKQSPG